MTSFSSLMAGQKLLPIIQADTVEQGLNIARAMSLAGIKLVEVVLRTSASIDVLKAIKDEFPELIVGAGTVITPTILNEAIEAQADFIVTPTISGKLLDCLSSCGLPVLPGVSNAADILLAYEYGYRELKLFPASLSGGCPFLSAMSSIFQDISFCPTGGINAKNQHEYLALNNIFAVGGTWVADKSWVENENWLQITKACQEALQPA